jgi:hypothetical protein
MYQIRTESRGWAILNDRGERIFAGTAQQCEDWLDQQENLQYSQSKSAVGRRWLFLAGAISGGRQWFRSRQPGKATHSPACQ